jgi:hypothetical protein
MQVSASHSNGDHWQKDTVSSQEEEDETGGFVLFRRSKIENEILLAERFLTRRRTRRYQSFTVLFHLPGR